MVLNETKCEIVFANSVGSRDGVYYSGQRITGSVVLSFYEKQVIKEIYLQLNGIGKCQWSVQRRTFTGEEIYLKQITQLVHPSTDDKPFTMAPGVYTYKFQCDLPKELPTSCEEKFGFIRYLASVHIVAQPLSIDKVHSVAFTVIKPYNLNAEPLFQFATTKQRNIKFFRFLMLKLNQLTITASIPTSGYAPGQMIPLQLDVQNKSDRNLSEIKIELIKLITCFDSIQKNRKKYKKLLVTVHTDGCPANACTVKMPEILVPPAPSTDTVSSKILQVTYELKVYGRFTSANFKPLLKMSVTIGTVPLYSTYRCVHFEDSTENNHIVPLKYEASLEDLKKLPQFAPLYPVYRMRRNKKGRKTSENDSEVSI